ncbi:hypothetical protein [Desulfobulbus elongatus]|uniref:hypothetical protein n=1 Tax=Desulfobulbus elongatus TaxID=53332 RepID=UPI000489658C|nr:hypothetical protein [Desulfobulbus elongatus]
MASVSAEILRLLKAKDRKIVSGEEALRGLMADVRRQVLDQLRRATGGSYTALLLKQQLTDIERYLSAFESAAGLEMSSLLDAAWDMGGGLVPAAVRAGGMHVAFAHIPGTVLQVLKDYSFHKISGLAADAFTRIRGVLSLGILGQQTPHEVVQAIAGNLVSPGVFNSLEDRAEVIAGVEMGRAYSTATQESMRTASGSVSGLKKQWWHAGHPKRPRLNHLNLHGQVRPVNEPFTIGSLAMMYPRDPNAPASEVIRCGCDHVPYHEEWGIDEALPIFNECGEEIARRGERKASDPILTGKFDVGRIGSAASGCAHDAGCVCYKRL